MKTLCVALFSLLLSACSRETPAPASKPSTTRPSPLNAGKPAEIVNAPKVGEGEAEANIRGLLRMDGHPCDRVISMEAAEPTGRVVCAVGEGTLTYLADRSGRFTKQ